MQRIGSALGIKSSSSSGSLAISETDESTIGPPGSDTPQLTRHHSSEEGLAKQNGNALGSHHVKFDVGGDDDEEPHYRRPRNRKNSTFGILDLNEDWITRNHFLERLESESLPSDVIHAKLAEIAEDSVKEKETCRHRLAKHMTTTAFTIFILIIALLDATVTITAVILQIHSEHDELVLRRDQHKRFTKYTKYAYGSRVDLEDIASTYDLLDRVGKYINGTKNATADGNTTANGNDTSKSVQKRDLFSFNMEYIETSDLERGQGQDFLRRRGRGGRRKRSAETTNDKDRGPDQVLSRRKRAAVSADGTPLFESKTAQKLADISHYLHFASIALLSILLLEVMFKIFALGCEFFRSKVEVIDMIIISIAFFLDVYFIDSVMDNVAAAILLFIWQMIRVCTTLILQDRKRIDFLLEVVKESNDANKEKVDKYQEQSNSYATAVQRLTTLAKYNGASEAEIRRCVEIIEQFEDVEETKKTQKTPVFRSLKVAISNVGKRKSKKGGFTLEQLEPDTVADGDAQSPGILPKRLSNKRLSTDINVELVHKQLRDSHGHQRHHRQSLHDLMHTMIRSHHHDSPSKRKDSHVDALPSPGKRGTPKRRIHFLDGDLNHDMNGVNPNLATPRFSFVSSFSPAGSRAGSRAGSVAGSPSVSRNSSILKNRGSPKLIRRINSDPRMSPSVSRSSSMSRDTKDSGYVNDAFSEDEEVAVDLKAGCESGASKKRVRRATVGFNDEGLKAEQYSQSDSMTNPKETISSSDGHKDSGTKQPHGILKRPSSTNSLREQAVADASAIEVTVVNGHLGPPSYEQCVQSSTRPAFSLGQENALPAPSPTHDSDLTSSVPTTHEAVMNDEDVDTGF